MYIFLVVSSHCCLEHIQLQHATSMQHAASILRAQPASMTAHVRRKTWKLNLQAELNRLDEPAERYILKSNIACKAACLTLGLPGSLQVASMELASRSCQLASPV